MTNSTTYSIYRIACFRTFKSYIGLTSSPHKRKLEHFRLLKQGRHYNIHLQRAFTLHGLEAFYFEVLESGILAADIDTRERYWIEYFDTHKNGYNESPGGDLSYRGKSCTWNGKQYDSVTAAALDNGVKSSTMRERFLNGYTCDDDIYLPGEHNNKPCVWNGISYPSQKAAAETLGISKEAMKGRIAKGYTCDDDMPQRKRCMWNGIAYRSICECSRATGIPHVTLIRWFKNGIVRDDQRPVYRRKG